MKVALRKAVRSEVGTLLRAEKVESMGVLTVTGLVPTPVDEAVTEEGVPPEGPDHIEQEAIVQDLLRRVRYLLTLKGRPPFRLAGIEMVERLSEVETCLHDLLAHHIDDRLLTLKQGIHTALESVHTDYTQVRLAADWLQEDGRHPRTQ